jgi:MOSC domain-containing protein YiiM
MHGHAQLNSPRRSAALPIDSYSTGDPSRHLPFDALHQALAALPAAPADCGTVAQIVARHEQGLRIVLESAWLSPAEGVPGDAWSRSADPHPDAQIAVMQLDVARLLSNGQPLELSGDNLWLDLDLSAANLPPGSLLRIGPARLEVSPLPHNGCSKFRARFGRDAQRLVSEPNLRHRNLRGIYLRVVEAGTVRRGDAVVVERRSVAAAPAAS